MSNVETIKAEIDELTQQVEAWQREIRESGFRTTTLEGELAQATADVARATDSAGYDSAMEIRARSEKELILQRNRVNALTRQVEEANQKVARLRFDLELAQWNEHTEKSQELHDKLLQVYGEFKRHAWEYYKQTESDLFRLKEIRHHGNSLGLKPGDYNVSRADGNYNTRGSFTEFIGDFLTQDPN